MAPLLAAGAAAVVWCLRWWLSPLSIPGGDTAMYLDLARGVEPAPPWSFHVLTPWIAGTLFQAHPSSGFALVAAFSFVASAAAIERVLAALEARPEERAFGVALFMVTSTGVFMVRQFLLVDALSYCLLAWACAWTLQGRDLLVSIITACGLLNRETALFVIPVWLWANRSRRRVFLLAGAVFSPAALVYLALHHTSLAFGHPPAHLNYLSPPVIAHLWRTNLHWLGTEHRAYGLAICVVMAYGPVWFLAARGAWSALRRRGEMPGERLFALWTLALPSALALVVGVDWRRGFQPLFLPVISSAALALRGLLPARGRILALVTVVSAATLTEAWWHPPMGRTVVTSLALWIVAAAALLRGPAAEGRAPDPGQAAAPS